MRFLVTGHTGFKGSWLSLLLHERGHEVCGLALEPERGSLFEQACVSDVLAADVRCDIRDGDATVRSIAEIEPEIVIHMAAQPLVRSSYEQPRLTMETNVMGTLSVLEGISAVGSARVAVMVTTDKVYRNVHQSAGYVEGDALGGHDPYSASKAMADILITSWDLSFPSVPMAIARAGNVIGGGDVSQDRLMPDLIRSFGAGEPARLRNPSAVRPWQHVLDCLNGYLLLVDALLEGRGAGPWNFGPDPEAFRTVGEAADEAVRAWGPGASWVTDGGDHPHEAELLTLDSSRARDQLGWSDRLDFAAAVDWTVDWARRVQGGEDARSVTLEQIAAHASLGTDRR